MIIKSNNESILSYYGKVFDDKNIYFLCFWCEVYYRKNVQKYCKRFFCISSFQTKFSHVTNFILSPFLSPIKLYHMVDWFIISYHIISYHIILFHIISHHIISCHIISYYITSYRIISYHMISHHIISYHIISYNIASYHIMSCHIILYHIISYYISSYYIIPYIFTDSYFYDYIFIRFLGLVDVYYHSPKNRKYRSRVEAAISLSTFLR